MAAVWEAAVNDQNQALASFSFCQAQHASKYLLDSKENMPALCLQIMGRSWSIGDCHSGFRGNAHHRCKHFLSCCHMWAENDTPAAYVGSWWLNRSFSVFPSTKFQDKSACYVFSHIWTFYFLLGCYHYLKLSWWILLSVDLSSTMFLHGLCQHSESPFPLVSL